MNVDKVNALVQEAIKSIKLSTDYVDCLFFQDDSLYGFCRKLRRPAFGSMDSLYGNMRLTTKDPSLTDEEKQDIYLAVFDRIQKS